jgi:hypothetical protein
VRVACSFGACYVLLALMLRRVGVNEDSVLCHHQEQIVELLWRCGMFMLLTRLPATPNQQP